MHRMETLKRHLPFSGPDGLLELKKIAVRFEEKTYAAATSQSDYLKKISLKMLTVETKSQNPMANSSQSNAANNSQNSQDPASQSMQSQLQNQVQPLPTPMVSNQSQARQQLLSQNISNNIASSGGPNSATLTSALPPGGMSQGTMPNVACQNPNMQNIQNMSNVTSNAVGNSMGQGVPSNIFANSQRQIPGRQQQVVPQEQQQQSQNSQQYQYNQQLQHHLMKQKTQQGSNTQSLMQSQILQQQQQQQQNLLQSTQLQSSQHAIMQPSLRQSSASSTLQQNQQSSLQPSSQSMLQQQSQSVLRQHQQQSQQPSMMHQQQNSMPQHPLLPTQQPQPQQLSGQPNTANMQQNQLNGQQHSVIDAQQSHQQQQRLMPQQNNISNLQQQKTISQQNNMHQHQSTAQQNNLPNIHPQNNLSGFQQQQMVGIQHGNSGLQTSQQTLMLQQSKVAAQQQMQQKMTNLLPNQAQQSQPSQQQMMSQIQSQPSQMQQGFQQTANPSQRDMQQRIQPAGSLLQQTTTVDQQKQLLQSQRIIPEVPLTSLDSSSHTGNANGGDWQEEIYQKIKSMNEMYFPELNECYHRIAGKLQQHGSLPQGPQQPENHQLDKFRIFKVMLERLILFLRTKKNELQPNHKEKVVVAQKQILNFLNSNRPQKPVSSMQQGQVSQSQMHAMQQSQQPQPQISQIHTHENQMSSQMQPMNVQGPVATTQQNNLGNLQHNTSSSISNVPNSCQNMIDALQPGSNIDPGQGNGINSVQQVAMSSVQQNPVSGQQQMNINSISSQGGLTTLQSNVNPLQASTNILQSQHVKQEQQMFSAQQFNQFQQRKMQQQYMQRQQVMQQQQQQHQTAPHQSAQQMVHLNQMNDTNDVKMRQQIGGKSVVIQQPHSSGQRPTYHHQQMNAGAPFSISSPQVLQAASSQIGYHPSPQLDQQNLLISHTKASTPLQSANSPFIVPSPSTSMAPSPMPGDSEKLNSGVSLLSNAGNNLLHPITGPSVTAQSLAIGTPGISASPLLAEFTSPDSHGVASTIVSGNSIVVEQPLDRLIKVVKSMSPKALSASVSDISSVVSMVDRVSGSAPGNGSRATVGEDLVAMTKCRLQARSFFAPDGPCGTKRMRRYTSAVPSSVVSSTGSVNDSLRHFNGCESDGESTGASSIKRPRFEANHALEEELREINQRLIDTVVYISEDDIDPTVVAAAGEGGEGIIVKCSFSAVALSPNLKSQYSSAQMSPIQPLRLLIPSNYPNCSPILLDKFPVEVSKEYEDLWIKTKSRFSISLRALAQPMSLGEMARTWDICARSVISEYAQRSGGGSFSSKYGTWENNNCLSAA
ncbi:hypothetical protein RD792_015846 [Penstemon davidsonii]|uniref:Mediator complex subunit 15 KIX domain-containing protein n=1 Tax=Penstemon davidsonii TaxID=160366 RepID=A0ABR0CHR9_9LAMI|nr:hypothetical protein RD792_015846 [Penstemon davidsonii]